MVETGNTKTNNRRINNGTLAILTILGGLAAIWGAMQLQLRHMGDTMKSIKGEFNDKCEVMRRDLHTHEVLQGHPGMMARVVRVEKQHEEIETQFDWAADVANLRANNAEKWVQLLWKAEFGTELPSTDYWPFKNGKE